MDANSNDVHASGHQSTRLPAPPTLKLGQAYRPYGGRLKRVDGVDSFLAACGGPASHLLSRLVAGFIAKAVRPIEFIKTF